MSFYEVYKEYSEFDFKKYIEEVTEEQVECVLNKEKLDEFDFLTLLSPLAREKYLEEMAQKAQRLSLNHFGKAIVLYTPMYIANYCINRCAYCSYNIENKIARKKLTMEEIEKEARVIAETGLKHILVLTGESNVHTPVSYIADAVEVLKKYFNSIAIEVYPLKEDEYKQLVDAGADSLTVYQEVYDEKIYDRVHISGPKKNYKFRLDAPERGCKAGMRGVNIGALLGLDQWRKEAFMTVLHVNYLQNKYSEVEISMSLPRIRPFVGGFNEIYPVEDIDLVQIMLAARLYLPYISMNMSTRESRDFRDNLIPLGINKMSAGVSTEVGGHSKGDKGEAQFEINDSRTVDEVRKAILNKGYQPVFKNWMQIY